MKKNGLELFFGAAAFAAAAAGAAGVFGAGVEVGVTTPRRGTSGTSTFKETPAAERFALFFTARFADFFARADEDFLAVRFALGLVAFLATFAVAFLVVFLTVFLARFAATSRLLAIDAS